MKILIHSLLFNIFQFHIQTWIKGEWRAILLYRPHVKGTYVPLPLPLSNHIHLGFCAHHHLSSVSSYRESWTLFLLTWARRIPAVSKFEHWQVQRTKNISTHELFMLIQSVIHLLFPECSLLDIPWIVVVSQSMVKSDLEPPTLDTP